jgi:hypothetical protein
MSAELNPPHAIQAPLHRAMADAMVASVPQTWNEIVMTFRRTEGGFRISLYSPEGHPPTISQLDEDALDAAIENIDETWARYGVRFDRVRYHVSLKPDSWSYNFAFDFPESE